ncbi:MAG: hypothetical protein EA369_01060 [Bradymonadales bacterium]|nr:MAG: hypothetical protein EA369_01060 [Bradymonadales bacterium]
MNLNPITEVSDRLGLIDQLVGIGMKAVYNRAALSDAEINQALSESVRHKLLSPEESYKLRDLIYQAEARQVGRS